MTFYVGAAALLFVGLAGLLVSFNLHKVWCRYGRETLVLVSLQLLLAGFMRVADAVGLLTLEESREVNAIMATVIAILMAETIFLHFMQHLYYWRRKGNAEKLNDLP